jgi:ferredoxin
MVKIKRNDIAKLLSQWHQERAILLPSRAGGIAQMARWDGEDTSFLDWYRNTVLPAKASSLPTMEEMFRFQKGEEGYQIEPHAFDGQKQLIFGIRPCDARALAMLDMVFKDGYEDPYYLSRRRNTLLVGLTCAKPYDSCFCTSLGGAPSDSTNVDLMVTDIGDEFLIEEVTEAGKELIAKTSGLKAATEADDAQAREVKEASDRKVTRKIDTTDITNKLQSCFENEDYWEKVAAKCISCGICTFLCPTCYCFDITDDMVGKQGVRFRCWDSCAFPIYTKMPMENPRAEKWRRVRQKVYHKYEFYPMNFDAIACTGCGRCIRLCPVNWDITRTLASLPVPD